MHANPSRVWLQPCHPCTARIRQGAHSRAFRALVPMLLRLPARMKPRDSQLGCTADEYAQVSQK